MALRVTEPNATISFFALFLPNEEHEEPNETKSVLRTNAAAEEAEEEQEEREQESRLRNYKKKEKKIQVFFFLFFPFLVFRSLFLRERKQK